MEPSLPAEVSHFARELLLVDKALKYAGVPNGHRPHFIGEESGRLIDVLVAATGPQSILEIGTSYGYSTLWLAAAAKRGGASMVTVERSADRSRAAQRLLDQYSLSGRVEFVVSEARDYVDSLDSRPDFVLLDATKSQYTEIARSLWERHGTRPMTLLADNMISHRAEMGPFVEYLSSEPAVTHVLLPIGKGIELCYFVPGESLR